MLIATILFIALVAFSIRPKCKFFSNEIYEDGWSFDDTNAIRGVIALTIVFCHLSGKALIEFPFLDFAYAGAYGVGVFFFLSGYALQLKTTKSQIGGVGYLKGFFSKRFSKILYPYIAFLVVYSVIDILFLGELFVDILERFRWGDPVSNSWYVLAILIFYVFFYISNIIKKGKYSTFLIFAFTAVYIGLLALLARYAFNYFCIPDWYYKTVVLFPIGCFVGKYKNVVDEFLKRKYWLCLVVVGGLFGIALVFPAIYNRTLANFIMINKWFVQDVMVGLFGTLFIILLVRKVSIANKTTTWLGKHSFEIYLVHGLVIECLTKVFNHTTVICDELFTIFVVLISIGLSIPLKLLFDFVTKITTNKI